MTRAYYGPSKEQIARAKRERKEAKRRPIKRGRELGPVKYGVTAKISNTERTGDDDHND